MLGKETSDKTFPLCVIFLLCIHLGTSPSRTFRKERPLSEKQNNKKKMVGRSCLSHSNQRKMMFLQVVLDSIVHARVFRSSNYLQAQSHFSILIFFTSLLGKVVSCFSAQRNLSCSSCLLLRKGR